MEAKAFFMEAKAFEKHVGSPKKLKLEGGKRRKPLTNEMMQGYYFAFGPTLEGKPGVYYCIRRGVEQVAIEKTSWMKTMS